MAKREDELLAFFSDIPLLRAAITDPEPRRKQPDRPGAIARQIEAIRNSEGGRVIADLLGLARAIAEPIANIAAASTPAGAAQMGGRMAAAGVTPQSLFENLTSLDEPEEMTPDELAIDMAIGAAPGLGELQGVRDVVRDLRAGRPGSAAISGLLTAVPFVGAGSIRRAAGAGRFVDDIPIRLADTAPDLGPVANARREEMYRKLAEYSMRPDNSAPAGEFGTARFLTKEDMESHGNLGRRVAELYEAAESNPNDPAVRAAYEQFAKELDEQYRFVTEELGIEMIPTVDDPYKNSTEMARDVLENGRMRVFKSNDGDHPLLSGEANTKFRFVHDVLGHAIFGNTFGPRGEENAFRAHSEIFSPAARGALATETRGQNSWVNYGPYGASNRANPANTRYADQKVFLLPEEMTAPTPSAEVLQPYNPGPEGLFPRAYSESVGSTLTERPAFRRESVERSPSWGHDVFRYSTPQGPLEVIAEPKGSEIEIGWFGEPEYGEGSMPVGPRVVRGVMEDVANHYPDAETFGFSRISGSRTGPASGRTVDEAEQEWISRPIPRPEGFQPPAQGLFDSGAASIGGRPAQPEMPRPVLTEAASGDNVGIALNRSILDQIADTHNTMGGSTYNPRTGENLYGQPGFAVGAERSTERVIPSRQLTTEDLIRYQQDNPQLVTDPQSLLGTWVVGDQSHLDTPSLFKTERGAVRAGADNEQLAIFNLGTGEERPITIDELADSRHRRANRNKATRGALEERLQEGLLPHERQRFEGLDKRTRQNVLDVFARMPTPEELSHSMLAGMGHHGWYDTAAQTIAQVFGDDSHRFAALLAATSPRQSVEQNLDMALDIWDRWVRAGRPTDEAGIRATFPNEIMESRAVNSVKALSAPEELLRDPKVITEGGFLSGPKVDPFYGNLVGEVHRVVNDTHMAQMYGADPRTMGRVARLIPGTAATRLGGRIVQENLGIPFPGSRAQETGWSWKYALSNARDNISSSGRLPGASHDDIVREGFDLTPYLGGVARFDTMLRDPARAERISRIPGLLAPGPVTEPFTPPVDPGLIDRTALRRLAQRVDAVSAGRPLVGLLGAGLGLGAMQGLFSPEEEVQ